MSALVPLMLRHWPAFIGLAAAMLIAGLLFARTAERDAARSALERERAAHGLTVARTTAEAAMAARRFTESARRAEQDQVRISQEIGYDYQENVRQLRRRVADMRLRETRAGADPDRSGGTTMPGLPHAPGGADGAAGDTRLSLDERAAASEQALRLEALQAWIRRQADIPPASIRTGGPLKVPSLGRRETSKRNGRELSLPPNQVPRPVT